MFFSRKFNQKYFKYFKWTKKCFSSSNFGCFLLHYWNELVEYAYTLSRKKKLSAITTDVSVCVVNFRSLFFRCKIQKKKYESDTLSAHMRWDILYIMVPFFLVFFFIQSCYTPMRILLYLAHKIIHFALKWQQPNYSFKFSFPLQKQKKRRRRRRSRFFTRSKQLIRKEKWWEIKHKDE